MGEKYILLIYNNIMSFEKKLTKFVVTKFKRRINIENADDADIELQPDDKNDDFDDFEYNQKDIEIIEDKELDEQNVAELGEEEIADNDFSLENMDVVLEEEGDEEYLYKDVIDKLS